MRHGSLTKNFPLLPRHNKLCHLAFFWFHMPLVFPYFAGHGNFFLSAILSAFLREGAFWRAAARSCLLRPPPRGFSYIIPLTFAPTPVAVGANGTLSFNHSPAHRVIISLGLIITHNFAIPSAPWAPPSTAPTRRIGCVAVFYR